VITTATVRGAGSLDDTSAAQIADLWNAAYPTMRTIVTGRISSDRGLIRDEAWKVDASHPQTEVLRTFAPSEKDLRARLERMERLRLVLGQLDRATYRGCTRSPGGFSPLGAYRSVRSLLGATTVNDHDLASVYELAAALARASDDWHREMAARSARA
jgi:hypothetical protein